MGTGVVVTNGLDRLREVIEARGEGLSSRELLYLIRDSLGLLNVAYIALHAPPLTKRHFYSEVTYSDEWVERYISMGYVDIDPVMPTAAEGILPVDWSDINRSNVAVRNFFIDAANHGVGNQGMTIPIRGAVGERAFFSVNLQASDDEWRHFKRQSMTSLQTVAYFYHQKVLENSGISYPKITLPARQLEVLKWAANGKSAEDIATIMGISRSTARTYIELARTKLGALNVAHAVARAIKIGLIDPPE